MEKVKEKEEKNEVISISSSTSTEDEGEESEAESEAEAEEQQRAERQPTQGGNSASDKLTCGAANAKTSKAEGGRKATTTTKTTTKTTMILSVNDQDKKGESKEDDDDDDQDDDDDDKCLSFQPFRKRPAGDAKAATTTAPAAAPARPPPSKENGGASDRGRDPGESFGGVPSDKIVTSTSTEKKKKKQPDESRKEVGRRSSKQQPTPPKRSTAKAKAAASASSTASGGSTEKRQGQKTDGKRPVVDSPRSNSARIAALSKDEPGPSVHHASSAPSAVRRAEQTGAKPTAMEAPKAGAKSKTEAAPAPQSGTAPARQTAPAKATQSGQQKESQPPPVQQRPSQPPLPPASAAPTKSGPTTGCTVKKLSFQDTVHRHLRSHFKPFLLKDMAKELQTSETTLQYTMLSLADKGLVCSKEFAGSKKAKTLYWANHGASSRDGRLEPAPATADEAQEARERLALAQSELQIVQGQLAAVMEAPSNDQLASMVEGSQAELDELRGRLTQVRDRVERHSTATGPALLESTGRRGHHQRQQPRAPPAASSSSRLKDRIDRMASEGRKRRRICMEFVERVADGMEKKPRDVVKMLELETDVAAAS
jgi:hypothetical protein